jgi:uncharacterized delta-60 repeat protein
MSGTGRQSQLSLRAVLLLACLAAAWAGLTASSASAKKGPPKKETPKANVAGSLDPSFGKGGKATVAFPAEEAGDLGVKYELPFQFTAGHLAMAAAPEGKIVVAGSTKIVRFLSNGKPDPGFGVGGTVGIERPAGQTFVLADVAVDSQGRILVAGSARPQPSASTPDPLVSSAMVVRFTADGSIDRSFAKEGTLISDLGIEPPKIGSTRYIGAAVGLRSLVVDPQDRPVLTGGSVSEVVSCYSTEHAVSTAFVARLTDSGALDPGFGDAGLRQIVDLSSFDQGSLTPSGALFTVGSGKFRCEGPRGPAVLLTGFGLEGSLDPNFGFAGFRSVGFSSAPVAAIAPSGRIVLLGARRGRKPKTQMVMRLLPDGGLDPSFGRTGRVVIVLGKRDVFTSVAVDGSGRLLFAGRTSKPLPGGPLRSTFLLARMNPKGGFDRSFGRRGAVKTGFGGPSSSAATQVMLAGQGRILVGGQLSSSALPTGGGFALARYMGSR